MFKKEENSYREIKIKNETYIKLKIISDIENKSFTEIIDELLSGKQITL